MKKDGTRRREKDSEGVKIFSVLQLSLQKEKMKVPIRFMNKTVNSGLDYKITLFRYHQIWW